MADKTTFTWDVFYKGKEGYAEHVQVGSESSDALIAGRGDLLLYLIANEATTLPRDKEFNKPTVTNNPNVPAGVKGISPGITPVCPEDGGNMQLRPAGISGPSSRNPGKPYPAFYSCTNFPECRGRISA